MASRSGGRSRLAAGLPAITADQVIAAATALTKEHGLDGWSVRQLAQALGVWPAVVYHHVGERDAVLAAVTERVVAEVPLPHADLPWRAWFTELLAVARPVLRAHRGVAGRLALSGATVPSALRIIDRSQQVLARAGFGEEAVLACSVLLGTACQLIAVDDDRDAAPHVGGRAHCDQLYQYAINCCLDGLEVRLASL